MPYDITLPDGRVISDIPDNISQAEAKARILKNFPEFREKGFGAAVKSGLEGLVGAGLGVGLGLNPESEKLRSAVQASQEAQEAKYGGPSYADVEQAFTQQGGVAGLKSLYEFGKGAIGQSLPYMAAPLAGGRLGAMAGTAIGGPAGGVVGGLAGAGLASAAQFFGTNIGRQVQEGQPVEPGKAALAAIPQAALDVGSLKLSGLGRIFGMEGEKAASQITKDIVTSYKKGIPLHAVKGLSEVPTEVAQQVLERAQAGKDLTGDDAYQEYKASAAAAGLMGPTMGAVGGASQTRANQRLVQEQRAAQQQQAAAQAVQARQEDQARRQAFAQQQAQIEQAAMAQRMDEQREGSKAYAPINAAIQARQEEQARIDAQKAGESAFAQNIPDVFGEFRPEQQVSQVVTPEETPQAVAPQPGQMGLPFTDETGQQSMFPEMMPAAPVGQEFAAPEEPQGAVLGQRQFDAFGFTKHAGIRKRLAGVDVMTREGRNKFEKEIEKYGKAGRQADWNALEAFGKSLPPLEQDVLGLEGGYAPTQANEVLARNTEAPGVAVRPRYDASGQRIMPKGPTVTLQDMQRQQREANAAAQAKKDQRAIAQERATREFMFGGQETPESTQMLRRPNRGQNVRTGDVAGGSESGMGVPVQRRAVTPQTVGTPEQGAVAGPVGNVGANDGGEGVRLGALTATPQEEAFAASTGIAKSAEQLNRMLDKNRRSSEEMERMVPVNTTPEEAARLKELLEPKLGSTREGNLNYAIQHAKEALERDRESAEFYKPRPESKGRRRKAEQETYQFYQDELTKQERMIDHMEGIRETAQRLDDEDRGRHHNRSMLNFARQELEAAVRGGAMTEDEARQSIERARSAGNADIAADQIYRDVDRAVEGKPALEGAKPALPAPETKPKKGGRPKLPIEKESAVQADQYIKALDESDQPAERQASVINLYRIAADEPNTPHGQKAAARLDQDDVSQEQIKQADKIYKRDQNVKENKARNPDKFGAPIAPEVLAQPTNGKAVLDWLANNAKNSDVRKIAQTINANVDLSHVSAELASPDNRALPQAIRERLESALGLYGQFKGGEERVFVRDDGQNEITVLHELVHAATFNRLKDPRALAQFKGLMKKVEAAADARYGKGGSKEKVPESVAFFGNEALRDPDEFVAYGFSSPTFRAWLDSMGPKQSMWQQFVDVVKRVLGIKPEQAKTFKQVMDSMLEPLLGTAPVKTAQDVKASLEASPTADLYERTKRLAPPADTNKSFFDNVVDKVGKIGSFFFDPDERSSMVDAFRTKNVFYGAAVENRLQKQYNGAIMDAMGNVRPDINLLQALHADNLGAATLFKGKLTLDKEIGGWWKAVEDKDSMSSVFQKVHALEQKIGEDEARHAVQVFLLAARSDALNKANADTERQAQALEAKGKKKDAEKIRDKLKHVHLTDDEVSAGLDYAKAYPELRDILDTYTNFKNNLIDSMVESGRFGKEQSDDLKAAIDYVPFHRIQEEEQRPSGQKEYFRGLTDLGKLYKFTGSEKPVDNILDNMVQMSMWMVNNAVRNHAALRLADAFGARDGSGKLIARDAVAPGKGAVSVPIFMDGKRKFIEVGDPLEAQAFKGVEPVTLPIVTTLVKFSDILRKGTTMMPNFLVSQVIQDSMRAATLSGVKNPATVAGKTMAGFVSALGNKDPILQEMEAYGIAGAYDYTPGAAKEKAERELGLKRRSSIQKVMDAGEKLAVASDSAQRRAIYDQTLKETGDKSLALYRAMEIINFKRQGSNQSMNIARRLVPFMNAYIQGMDVLARTMSGKGVAGRDRKEAMNLFWRAGMKVAALSLLYSMAMGDDEDYEKQDDRTRARNFFIPGTDLKLPVPSDVGFFFKVIPELAYRYITTQGTDNPMDARKLRTALASAAGDALLGPTPIPQAVKTPLEVAINHSFFTGNPIIGRGIEKKETSQQFTENTSEIAKFIGSSGLVSPMNVDYMIRGTLGSVGGLLLFGGDSLAGAMLDNPRPSIQAHKAPVISTFLANPEGRGLLSDYYDLKDQSDTVFNTLKGYVDQRDMGKAREYVEENKQMLATRAAVSAIGNQIEKLRTVRKSIISDASLTSEQKRVKLDEVDAVQNRMLANVAKLRQASGM